ncbi:hypothetical protein [Kribbella sp. NPDC000426]|uniref:hypothetical protein n=1 Tax=Kribbella sp. NPDC000426 TaxID=3154255 RepID=UPI00331DCB39
MAVYRAVWRAFCGVLAVFVMVAAGLALPVEILGLAFLLALAAGVLAATFYVGSDDDRGRWRQSQVVITAAAATGVITLVPGLTVVLGSSVLWLTVLIAAGSPPVVDWCRGQLHLGTATVRANVPERSTADLCREWRDSYDALRQAKTDRQRLRIVLERQHCLDELGRRDPEGLQAWLASSASAAGDPSRFLKNQ